MHTVNVSFVLQRHVLHIILLTVCAQRRHIYICKNIRTTYYSKYTYHVALYVCLIICFWSQQAAYVLHKNANILHKNVNVLHKNINVLHKNANVLHKNVKVMHKKSKRTYNSWLGFISYRVTYLFSPSIHTVMRVFLLAAQCASFLVQYTSYATWILRPRGTFGHSRLSSLSHCGLILA